MTAREIYESTLVEINKENSQSFTTEEFNYILNKAVLALINEKYNFYAVNQQLSDDLRVLLKNQTFSVTDTTNVDPGNPTVATYNPTTGYLMTDISSSATTATLSTARDLKALDTIRFGDSTTPYVISSGGITGNVITFTPAITLASKGVNISVLCAPVAISPNDTTKDRTLDAVFSSSDYLHLISCRVLWKIKRPSTWNSTGEISHLTFPAKRLTYDMLNAIQNNTYLKPAPNRPYYQLFDNVSNSGVIKLDIATYKAYQNKPKAKIHVGNVNTTMELRSVEFDYLKMPETVILLDEEIFTAGVDTSQILELPDYLKNEVVKRCTIYLLEKAGDPRVQTQPAFNQEIPSIPMSIQMGSQVRQQTDKSQ